MIRTAIERDPRSPYNYRRYEYLGLALLSLRQNDEAIIWTERALAEHTNIDAATRASLILRIAAAHAGLGRLKEARRAVTEANRVWPYDTVRTRAPYDPSNRRFVSLVEGYQDLLRLAGHRDHVEEVDFGLPSDDKLHADFAGPTPETAPGVTTIRTADLPALLDKRKPIVIDPLLYTWGKSIPGAIGLLNAGWGSSSSDSMLERLSQKMQALTKGDVSTPIVAVSFNSERFDGRNLAMRLVALGYTNVYWYRGGREAWEVARMPETAIDDQDW